MLSRIIVSPWWNYLRCVLPTSCSSIGQLPLPMLVGSLVVQLQVATDPCTSCAPWPEHDGPCERRLCTVSRADHADWETICHEDEVILLD
jgi:hypothetical protein